MALIQVPLQRGQDAKVEAKVAPTGVLKTLANARRSRVSRVAKRSGAVAKALTGQGGSAVMSASLPIQALFPSVPGLAVAKYSDSEDRLYGFASDNRWLTHGTLSPLEAPERLPAPAAWGGGSANEVSSAYANGLVCMVFTSSTDVSAVVYDVATRQIRDMESLDTGTVIRKARVVACGNTFVACWAENTSAERILCRSFDTTAAGGTWGSLQNMTNGLTILSANYDFDICAYSSTQIAVVFRRNSTDLSVMLWAFGAGTATGPTNFTADGVGLAVLGATGENIAVAWRDASDNSVKIQTFNGSLTSVAGPTTISADTTDGPVALLRGSSSVVYVFWTNRTTTDCLIGFRSCNTTSHSLGTSTSAASGLALASKPVAVTSDLAYVWTCTDADFQRNYCLVSLEFTNASPIRGIHATAAHDAARNSSDSDHLAELSLFSLSGQSYLAWGFPRILGDSVETGQSQFVTPATLLAKIRGTNRCQSASVGALRYISGGTLSCFDGLLVNGAGFSIPPQVLAAEVGTSGSMTLLATYQYVATLRVYAQDNLVLSQVSDPTTVTLTGSNNQTLVVLSTGPEQMTSYQRTAAGTTGVVRADIWRTTGNGSIFYRVSDADGQSVQSGLVEGASDSSITDNPVLYTQGSRGGLSGPLQNDTPPPCRYIWAGKDRAIVGGLEDPSEVRWSKLFFPGEGAHFSNNAAFRSRVPGRVSSVAQLDDIWVVFTLDAIFAISGAGPDDTANGSFDEPRKLGSDVGNIDWRSLVETPAGLMFQGRTDMIYLLPRGFGPVIPIARAIQDVLTTYPVVTSATLVPADNTVCFTVTTTDGSSGRLLVYDYFQTDEQGIGTWSVDTIAGGVAHVSAALWDGKLALATTSAIDVLTPGTYSDRGSWYGVTIETHPIKPSGMLGDGRVRMIGVVAEYRGDCGISIQYAVNDSQTFSSAHAFVGATAAGGLTAGDQVLRGWQVPNQKGGSYSVRISETQSASSLTEGCAFVGIAFDYRPREGARKIPPVNR